MTGALVLFSGGQDSTTCLAWALARYERVETVGFDYGQRHRIELACRAPLLEGLARNAQWRSRLGPDHLLSAPVLGEISESALTRETVIALTESGLPNTFVPARNLVFLTLAAALAYRRGLDRLTAGMCETDYSGYPDCRAATMRAMQETLSLGLDKSLVIDTPLMQIDKAQTWRLAQELGGEDLVELIRERSHSCYMGDRSQRHEWGYGCGACPACELRSAGWARFRASA